MKDVIFFYIPVTLLPRNQANIISDYNALNGASFFWAFTLKNGIL